MRTKSLLALASSTLCFMGTGCGQQAATGAAPGAGPAAAAPPHVATALDSLTTAAQVQQYLRKYGTDCQELTVVDTLTRKCQEELTCAVTTTERGWATADFDQDGRTDLLVIIRGFPPFFKGNGIACILNKKNQPLEPLWLYDNGQAYYCNQARVVDLQGKPAIRYAHMLVTNPFTKHPVSECVADTLVWLNEGFVEYNHAPKDHHITSIAFSTTECFGECPIFALKINHNGAASYVAEAYNKRQGRFSTVIKPQLLQKLWAQLNYLDFAKLKNSYAVPQTDHATCTLTITYGNGRVKTIEDYGEQGTFGLQRVYGLLFDLRDTQAWH